MTIPALVENPSPVQQIALGVIRDIEERGHFRPTSKTDDGYYSLFDRGGRCCVVMNPTMNDSRWLERERVAFLRAYIAAMGADLGYDLVDGVLLDAYDVPLVNDAFSTEDTLDALWAVALG